MRSEVELVGGQDCKASKSQRSVCLTTTNLASARGVHQIVLDVSLLTVPSRVSIAVTHRTHFSRAAMAGLATAFQVGMSLLRLGSTSLMTGWDIALHRASM